MTESTFTFQHVHDLSINKPPTEKKYICRVTRHIQMHNFVSRMLMYNSLQKLLFVARLSNYSFLDNSKSFISHSVASLLWLKITNIKQTDKCTSK